MSELKKKYIAILPADLKTVKCFFERNKEINCNWVYLGKNVLLSLSLNDLIGGNAKRLDIASLLQNIAKNTRQEYIDYIGMMGAAEKDDFWWLTTLSEKNPFISNLFLHICYLKVIESLSISKTEENENLIIICESHALMAAIALFLTERQDVNIDYCPPSVFLRDIYLVIVRMKNTAIYLVRWIFRCILSRLFSAMRFFSKRPLLKKSIILIHSWADHRSFRVQGKYEDIFLGRLGADLRKENSGVYYLIDILPTCFYPVALFKLFRTGERNFLLEEFLNPFDIVFSIYSVSTQFSKPCKIAKFTNFDIGPLITEELKIDQANFRSFQSYLCYITGRKICKRFEVRSFIYSFENLIWEKMFCLAFRDFSPDTAIIGYAHSTVSRMETFYSVSKFESDLIPLPDTIVVNGPRARDTLVASGFEPRKIVIGGAYRYPSVRIIHHDKPKNIQRGSILIIPTDDFNSTIELLTKSIRAFGSKKEIHCIIKLHPTLPRRKISAHLLRIPENFEVSEKPVEELLESTDVVVYTGSTVAVEALAQGIPIIHVRSDLIIDRDIFNEQDNINSVSTPEELCQAVKAIAKKRPESQRKGDDLVREFFAPINENLLGVFLTKPQKSE